MYRTYGSRATQGAVAEEQLPRSGSFVLDWGRNSYFPSFYRRYTAVGSLGYVAYFPYILGAWFYFQTCGQNI